MNPPDLRPASSEKLFYQNPTSSIVDPGKYVYLTFYSDYSAMF